MGKKDIKILIADDEEDILELLKYNLEKEGYIVFCAQNGKKAIEVAKEEIPDLIILDVMMPKMDGIEACHEMREIPQLSNSIITFLSARSEDFTQISGFEAGGDDYILKPVKPRVLISKVKALLKRSKTKGDEDREVFIGDLRVDKEQFKVFKNEEHIPMVKKEYEILNLLISKPGKVFTRQDILNALWGTDVIVGNRTIDVHIRKLRSKIGDDNLKTVKGVGYKFEVM